MEPSMKAQGAHWVRCRHQHLRHPGGVWQRPHRRRWQRRRQPGRRRRRIRIWRPCSSRQTMHQHACAVLCMFTMRSECVGLHGNLATLHTVPAAHNRADHLRCTILMCCSSHDVTRTCRQQARLCRVTQRCGDSCDRCVNTTSQGCVSCNPRHLSSSACYRRAAAVKGRAV